MDLKTAKLNSKKPFWESAFSTHNIAIFSICVYIICSIVFEFTAISLTALSSYSLYLCLGCCFFNLLAKRKLLFHWSLGILLLFGIMIWISMSYTPASSTYTDSRMYRYWTSLVLAFFVMNTRPNEKDIARIIHTFIIAGVALAAYIYLFYGFDTLANADTRLQNGDFGNVNVVGMHCAFAIILAVFSIVMFKKHRWLYILESIVCLPCVMFTGSRKALLALIVCILAFFLFYSKKVGLFKRILIAAAIITAIILILSFVPAFEPIKERMIGLFEIFGGNDASVVGDENRIRYITEGWKAFLQKPFFGHGFCYSYHIFGAYSHNNYIEILMCHGAVGFLIWYGFFVALAIANARSKANSWIKSLVYLVIIKMLVEDIGSVTYYNRITFLILAILACCTLHKQQEEKTLHQMKTKK